MTLLSLDGARALLLADVAPVDAETLPLAECGGRTLAADIVADRDQPPDPVSAMDGYAVRAEDAVAGAVLTLIGEAPAGRPFAGAVAPGSTVRIATWGVVPPGADRIVIQEIVARDGEEIRILEAPGPSSYVRPPGCDFRAGEVLVRAGDLLAPARVGLAAAANLAGLEVRRRPRVAIFASGDELREPGSPLAPGEIVNSAAYALVELVAAWGGIAIRHPILSDDSARCTEQIAGAGLDADIILPLGGASVGDRDVLRPVLQGLGARMIFERIAVQPGKPCWHARFSDGSVVLGLPGNPASAFVCAHLLLKPLMLALLGRAEPDDVVRAALARAMPEGADREVYWRARLRVDDGGRLEVTPDERQDSSLQTPLAAANALIRRLANAPPAAAGDMAEVLLIGSL
ncbi:MAG: molybdopterin molybdotransferase [Sphingomonadales bacterium]|jgi:molybdopterin molybdotransferase|nr:molybdopterin molybdotransferase [Sphingomonadales bacterium]